MDKILIRDLQVEGIIGIHPEERVQKQPLLINLVLYGDTRPAGQSDNIDLAMNYQALSEAVIAHVATGAPLLVERLAEEIADLLFRLAPLAQKVRVRVEKPAALAYTRTVGVEIVRRRQDVATSP
ncbi:MAG: dihydroneopterin aldolase [Anaerolineales bacterium]|nr:dihydroneopterin aldolase [Anaerolineales bacterium]MCB8961085.1 dihydroneopterin aldolase [Ardenticatenales bacterium]